MYIMIQNVNCGIWYDTVEDADEANKVAGSEGQWQEVTLAELDVIIKETQEFKNEIERK